MPRRMTSTVASRMMKSKNRLSPGAPVVLCIWNSKVWMPFAPPAFAMLVAVGGAGGTGVCGTAVGGGGAAGWMTGRALRLPS